MSTDLSGQRLAHYALREVVGRGGMSVVYRAIDERLDRPVALKVMTEELSADPEFRRRFIEEARAASAIDHVNVVPLYDFGEAQGWLFIAMRLVDGTDLARELSSGPLAARRAINLLGQVGAALDVLHDRGLVHLDVKPANVLITRSESIGNEHVYLADFGLTRRGATGHRTASGDFLGSPTYASPEHLRGLEVAPSSDEYSLTCMLFSCLAGRAPYTGSVREVITGHLSGRVPSLSALTDLSPTIDRVIARGMASEPSARYPSSADLLGAVRKALSDLPAEPPPVRADLLSTGPPYGDPPPAVRAEPLSTGPPFGDPPPVRADLLSTGPPFGDPPPVRADLLSTGLPYGDPPPVRAATDGPRVSGPRVSGPGVSGPAAYGPGPETSPRIVGESGVSRPNADRVGGQFGGSRTAIAPSAHPGGPPPVNVTRGRSDMAPMGSFGPVGRTPAGGTPPWQTADGFAPRMVGSGVVADGSRTESGGSRTTHRVPRDQLKQTRWRWMVGAGIVVLTVVVALLLVLRRSQAAPALPTPVPAAGFGADHQPVAQLSNFVGRTRIT